VPQVLHLAPVSEPNSHGVCASSPSCYDTSDIWAKSSTLLKRTSTPRCASECQLPLVSWNWHHGFLSFLMRSTDNSTSKKSGNDHLEERMTLITCLNTLCRRLGTKCGLYLTQFRFSIAELNCSLFWPTNRASLATTYTRWRDSLFGSPAILHSSGHAQIIHSPLGFVLLHHSERI
jgi:hypothetical protein